ncbi:leucine-rich colipase-like protein 1 isoform X2 [Antechinus flavipes]|uniref:leucine-rich colipase-like protein 1 isoform X2 n=1 Tax=Antechinus flavipes TaxID=38775 RepID=UPI002235AF94|nr:leucine-rich colipase-like protein 1 isoform X2 [Antechinus flavipes]
MGERRCWWQPRPLPASRRPTARSPPSVVPAPHPWPPSALCSWESGERRGWLPPRRAGFPVLSTAGMLLGLFTKVGILKLLLIFFLLSQGSMKYHKRIGESCQMHIECFSECCVPDSNMVKRCTRRTLFMQCKAKKKPFLHLCHHPSECSSNCCIPFDSEEQSYCASRTIFMKCITPKKIGRPCSSHEECKSNCCLGKYENFHCIPKTGVLQKCFLPKEKKNEIEEEVTTIGIGD